MLCLPVLLAALVAAPFTVNDPLTLLRFGSSEDLAPWRAVHDGVMGGVSSGDATWVEGEGSGAAHFQGRVRLENNGGFASFRANVGARDLSEYDGIRLRVRGGGQVWKLSLRTDGKWDGVGWQAPFATSDGEWSTVHIPFAQLTPTWRGRLVSDAPAFDASSVREIGLVIADKQVGPFTLDVGAVEAWRAERTPDAEPRAGSRAAALGRTAELASAVGDADTLLKHLTWSERLVVVAEPARRGDLGAEASLQLGALLALDEDLAARDLRTVHLIGERGRIAGRTLDAETTRALRTRWELPEGEFGVALVGKDGGVKQRWEEPVAPATIFGLVDAMPMRAEEQRER